MKSGGNNRFERTGLLLEMQYTMVEHIYMILIIIVKTGEIRRQVMTILQEQDFAKLSFSRGVRCALFRSHLEPRPS